MAHTGDKLFTRLTHFSKEAVFAAMEEMKRTLCYPNQLEITNSTFCVLHEDGEETGIEFDVATEWDNVDLNVENFCIKSEARFFEFGEERLSPQSIYFSVRRQKYLICQIFFSQNFYCKESILERLNWKTQALEHFDLGLIHGSTFNIVCYTFSHLGLSRYFEANIELIEQNIQEIEAELSFYTKKVNDHIFVTEREEQYRMVVRVMQVIEWASDS